jgi:hypothetical protein
MDIESLLETITEVSEELYPDVPEVAKLCQAIMIWERKNISVALPHYKEPLARLIKGVEDRMRKRLTSETQEE